MGIKDYLAKKKAEHEEFKQVKMEAKTEAKREFAASYKRERIEKAKEEGRQAAIPLTRRFIAAAKPVAQRVIREARGPPQRGQSRASEGFGGMFGGSSGGGAAFVPFGGYGATKGKRRKKSGSGMGNGMFGNQKKKKGGGGIFGG